MQLKQIITDQDWSEAVRLRNSFMWNTPITIEEAKLWHKYQKSEGPDERRLVFHNGELVSYIAAMKVTHDASGKSYRATAYVDRDHPEAADHYVIGIQSAESILNEWGVQKIIHDARSENPWTDQCLTSIGFQRSMRYPVSSLKVSANQHVDVQLPEGHEIISYAQLKDRKPNEWEHDLWRIEMDVAADLPLPFPFVESPLESFAEELADPTLNLRGQFLYLVDGYPAGLSQIHPSLVNPVYGTVGLTGVRREFRRQHIATKLKQFSAGWAKGYGIEEIFTDNEENNPMYQLNLSLGFEHRFDNLVYSKTV